jgi:hypothetical protein
MPPSKRQKTEKVVANEESDEETTNSGDELVAESSLASGSEGDGEGDASADTDDEIANARPSKSKKTLKRKRRAIDTTHFGSALQSLLSTDTPSALPLSLKPSVARKRNDEKLEAKGKKIIQIEKKDKEEKGRIKDVIGGWGGEGERALRKVAQRGGALRSLVDGKC